MTLRLGVGDIQQAAELLRAGKVVAFPTETVYGLGANALDADAVARIFASKGRPPSNPLIVHVADIEQARGLAEWNDSAQSLAERFWPGPLTLVLPKRAVPDIVTAGGPTVALRMPAHPVALALLRAAGVPLAAPSANLSGGISATRAEHVLAGLDGKIDAVLDGGAAPGGIESTVVGLAPPRLLRPGLLSVADIEAVIGPLLRGAGEGTHLPSPGLLERHYAPRTPFVVVEDAASHVKPGEGLLTHLEHGSRIVERLPADPAGYAAGLYDALHRLDAMGLARLWAEALPEGEEWLALRDRLRRASTPRP
ncbi:MAG: threonylcarbamoyl-AMP synthase [Gemmataceae bacterium]|nr:threonylcarbamoyl-AMP synthase [Gemmataceae bacterium]